MLIIGSEALNYNLGVIRQPKDRDVIVTQTELETLEEEYSLKEEYGKFIHFGDTITEYELALPDTSSLMLLEHHYKLTDSPYASTDELLMIKMSHRFKKDSPHFLKTVHDIHRLKKAGAKITDGLKPILKLREKETYTYSHPNLNVSKSEFFNNDQVPRKYDHDSIHEAVKLFDRPAYTFYMEEGQDVMTSKEKFNALPEVIKIAGVYEEACTLALERSQIPNNFTNINPEFSFLMALEKVCTSMTSGWFREFAWDKYFVVRRLYENMGKTDYITRFMNNKSLLKPF